MSATAPASSRAGARVVGACLVLLGVALLGYALSDHPFYGGAPGFGLAQALIAGLGAALALCALLPARAAGAILLASASALVMLGVLEAAAEWLLGPRHRPIYQADERLIFKFVPGRRSAMQHAPVNGGATVTHRINSEGFRGPELDRARQRPRVVVYGDSFVHAFYTPDEETFVARLGAALGERLQRPVEAVNAGVSSYGPDQVALKMEQELPRLQPDAVVVAIFAGNDYGDLMRNKMFRLAPDGTLAQNRWELAPDVRSLLERSQRESILVRIVRSLAARSAPASQPALEVTSIDFLVAEAQREYREFIVEGNNVVTNTHMDYYSADVSVLPESESARYKIRLMRAVMSRIVKVATEHRVPLAFVFVPHPRDVADEAAWPPVFDAARFPGYAGRNQVAPLEAAASEAGVPSVSLFDPFRAHGAEKLYLRGGDDHWNSAGQALAARLAAQLLIEKRLLGDAGRAARSGRDSRPAWQRK